MFMIKLLQNMPIIGWIVWAALIIGIIVFHCKRGVRRDKSDVLNSILIIYIAFVVSVTLVTRQPSPMRIYHLMPFWSWRRAIKEILERDTCGVLIQIIYNLFILFPIGFLLCFIKKISFKQAFVWGGCFSATIEVLQLTFMLGVFEWDDMLHNSIGLMTGMFIGQRVKRYLEGRRSRRKNIPD